jgi:hypothetical protein
MSNPDEMTYKDNYNNQNDDKDFYFIGKHQNLNLGFDLEEKLDISEEDNKKDENIFPFIYNPSLIEVITKSTDINLEELTKRKRNRPKNEVINNNPIFNYINNNENEEKEKKVNIEINIEIKPEVKNKATKRGRHKKGKSSGRDAKHNKFKADNIIRKIKTKIFQYIFKLLNNSLKHTNRRFLPLNKKLHDNLKRDLNLKLLESKIYEIYENSELNNRQIKYGNPNKKLIHKIFEEKIETKAITILNMTLNEMLNYIRKNDYYNFLKEIRDKEEKNNENSKEYINEYMNKVSNWLNGYEEWFLYKCGRDTTKKE